MDAGLHVSAPATPDDDDDDDEPECCPADCECDECSQFDDPGVCDACAGSGEGYCDGARCWTCGGSGTARAPRDDDDRDHRNYDD